MWDTSEDYRLLVAKESVELFERTLEGAKFRGKWDKKAARQKAEEMKPLIEEMRYSYMSPEKLSDSSMIDELKRKADEITESLGGDEWFHEFRDRSEKDEHEKVEESIAKVRFFLNTIRNLDERLGLGEIDDPIVGVDVMVGEIMSVSERGNLLVCNVDIGGRALRVVTNDTRVEERDRVGVALLPPSKFRGITSEGMFLGTEEGVLRNVEGEKGELPDDVPLDAFTESKNLVNEFLD